MPYLKAIIFDMDGTLVDNMLFHKQSWINLFKHHQLNLDYKTFEKKYHKGSLVEIIGRLFFIFQIEKNSKKLVLLQKNVFFLKTPVIALLQLGLQECKK